MDSPLAKWMVVTDALRSYVSKRGVPSISPQGRTEIIDVICREITLKKTLLGQACAADRAEMQAEITGAAHFLHALRQADESLPA